MKQAFCHAHPTKYQKLVLCKFVKTSLFPLHVGRSELCHQRTHCTNACIRMSRQRPIRQGRGISDIEVFHSPHSQLMIEHRSDTCRAEGMLPESQVLRTVLATKTILHQRVQGRIKIWTWKSFQELIHFLGQFYFTKPAEQNESKKGLHSKGNNVPFFDIHGSLRERKKCRKSS